MARRVWLAKKTCNENIGRSADPFSQAALLFFEREFGNRILTAEKVQYYEPSYQICTYMYLVELVPETPRVDGMHDVIKLNLYTPDFLKEFFMS